MCVKQNTKMYITIRFQTESAHAYSVLFSTWFIHRLQHRLCVEHNTTKYNNTNSEDKKTEKGCCLQCASLVFKVARPPLQRRLFVQDDGHTHLHNDRPQPSLAESVCLVSDEETENVDVSAHYQQSEIAALDSVKTLQKRLVGDALMCVALCVSVFQKTLNPHTTKRETKIAPLDGVETAETPRKNLFMCVA
jgi:hypothetical protein